MPAIRAVTVYCSSSTQVARVHFDAAAALGRAIGERGWQLVYGGNSVGLMAALADAARAAGAQVVGITPQYFLDKGCGDDKCHELIVAASMRDRKAQMESRGDAFIALPGGLGTLEEIFEIIVGRQLGYHQKPIVLLNIAGYYNPMLTMLDHGVEQRFIKPACRRLFHVATDVEAATEYLSEPQASAPGLSEPKA